jgi:hypothetical protein
LLANKAVTYAGFACLKLATPGRRGQDFVVRASDRESSRFCTWRGGEAWERMAPVCAHHVPDTRVSPAGKRQDWSCCHARLTLSPSPLHSVRVAACILNPQLCAGHGRRLAVRFAPRLLGILLCDQNLKPSTHNLGLQVNSEPKS